jgi:hypothetical protein
MQIAARDRFDAIVQRKLPTAHDLAEICALAPFGTKLLGCHDFARGEPHDQAAAGAQAPALHDGIRAEVDDAGLRSAQHLVARGAAPSQGAQPGSVQRGADRVAVGEHDRGRAVPRFDGRNVGVVVRAQTRVARFDRGREQHVDALVDAIAGTDHLVDVRIEIVGVAGTRLRLDTARFEPGTVAGDRVDLAVVRDVAERLNQTPRGRRVCREALVKEREARREQLVAQIVKVCAQLVGGEQRLVDDRRRGAREERGRRTEFAQRLLDHARGGTHSLAHVARAHVDQELLERRARGARLRTEDIFVRAGGPPAQRRDVERMHARFDRGTRGRRRIGLARQKEADRRQVARARVEVGAREFACQKFARGLAKDAGAVAGAPVGGTRPAVGHRRRRR